MSDDVEWISGRAAMPLLCAGHSYHEAASLLREALKRGRVSAVARDATVRRRGFNGYHPASEVTDWPVPRDVWAGKDENSHFDLKAGTYKSRDFKTGFHSVELHSLRFNRAELVEHFEIVDHPAPQSSPTPVAPDDPGKDKGGAPLDSEKWANFAAVAVVLHHHVGIVHRGMKKGSVHAQIADYASLLDLAIPSDRTVSNALDKMKFLAGLKHTADGKPMFDEHGTPLKDRPEET